MTTEPANPDYVSTGIMGALAFAGAVSRGTQWRDPKTGEISLARLTTGVATALMLTAIVRAIGVHYGVEITAQFALAGVFGYIGPDPIISVISSALFKRFGGGDQKDDGHDAGK